MTEENKELNEKKVTDEKNPETKTEAKTETKNRRRPARKKATAPAERKAEETNTPAASVQQYQPSQQIQQNGA